MPLLMHILFFNYNLISLQMNNKLLLICAVYLFVQNVNSSSSIDDLTSFVEQDCKSLKKESRLSCLQEKREKRQLCNQCAIDCNNNPSCLSGCTSCGPYQIQYPQMQQVNSYQIPQMQMQQIKQPVQNIPQMQQVQIPQIHHIPQVQQIQVPQIQQIPVYHTQSVIKESPIKLDIQTVKENQVIEYEPAPQPQGERIVMVNGAENPIVERHPLAAGHNITTIINLKNIVNNTNLVNVPTNINSTNINHIHIYQNETTNSTISGGKFNLGQTEKGDCCFAIHPKSCRKSSSGSRCHHRRHRTCGSQCTSRLIHVQTRRHCEIGTTCERKTSYIPQPTPRCVYTQKWPYVSCGKELDSDCGGCYDHYGYEGAYGYGYESAGDNKENSCVGCYDDAFDIGPLYRRGPVLRPFHSHEPPCMFTGMCGFGGFGRYGPGFGYGGFGMGGYGGYGGGFGGYGIGGYGYPGYPFNGMYGPPGSNILEGNDQFDTSRENDEISKLIEGDDEDETELSGDDDWAIQTYKCKIVEEDGSTSIKNCTSQEFNNQFARRPSDNIQRKRAAIANRFTNPFMKLKTKTKSKNIENKQKFPEDDLTTFEDDKGSFVVVQKND